MSEKSPCRTCALSGLLLDYAPPGSLPWAPFGEFETCTDWVPTVDKRRRCGRIDLKIMDLGGFDQRANRVAKVRNVSRLGSQS
jgi:hypothetical protein